MSGQTIETHPPRGAALPAAAGVRRAGERPARHLRARLRGVLGDRGRASGSPGSSRSTKLYEWEPPYAKWFLGGKLNVCFNCVDRHVEAGRGDKVAYYWEGEPEDDRRELTFADLQREVVRFANALKALGVGKGTPVGIYMGMVPELPIAMLACARLGAPHTVVFGGFSAESLSDRLNDMELRGADHAGRGLAPRHDRAAEANGRRGARGRARRSQNVVVLRRTGGDVPMQEGRDVWWHDARDRRRRRARASRWTPRTCSTSSTRAARPRSRRGSRTRPAGYLVGVATTHHYIFDLKPESRLLVRRRRRLGHRPQLHRLRAALQRDDRRHVRGHARLPRQGPLVGRSSSATGSTSSTPRRRRSART